MITAPVHSRRVSLALSAVLAVAGLVGVGAALATAAPGDVASDFTGHWATTPGPGFTIVTEDASGACTGTSDYASSGYGFDACQVTGSNYVFDVTYGSGYTSHNTGTFDSAANTLSGSFNDGSTQASYTGIRDSGGPAPAPTPSPSTTDTGTPSPTQSSSQPTTSPTTTSPTTSPTSAGPVATTLQLICNTPANAGQSGSCTATVGGAGGTPTHPYPTGGVTMTATSGTLFGSTCTLAAATGAGSAPSCTLQYLPPAGGLPAGTPVPVSAHYNGDGVFAASSAGTQLYGYAADPDSDQPLDVCQGSTDCDGFDESVAESLAADDGIINFVASCPAGGSASPMLRLETPAPDPQEASRLAQCILQFNAASANQANAPSLQSQARAKFMLNNLITFSGASVDQHTGSPSDLLNRRAAREILAALQAVGSGKPAVAATDATSALGAFHSAQTLNGDFAGGNGDEGAAPALASVATRTPKLDIHGTLLAVLSAHPSAAQRRAFANTVKLAAARNNSGTRVEARMTLMAARALGSIQLRSELTRHGRLPSPLALGSTKVSVKPGQVSHVKLTLTAQGQRILRVLSITPARHPVSVQLTITQTRATAKRVGHATLRVTAS